MPRPGLKNLTVPEDLHTRVKALAKEQNCDIQDIVSIALDCTYRDGVDVNQILLDLADTNKRVAKLEDALQIIMRLMKKKHKKDAAVISSILNSSMNIDYELSDDIGYEMTTEESIMRVLTATPVVKDPISSIPFIQKV